MRQRVGLLAGQDKAAPFGMCQSGLAVSVIHLRAFPLGHQSRCAVQALFCLDHLPGGEAILALSVLAEFDQIGRIAHRAHHLVELVDSFAMLMREPRYVAPREGRLLLRDRVQRYGRISDDALAVAARDVPVHLGAVSFDPFTLDTLRGRTDLALRLQRDALRLKAAMIDARVDIEFRQTLMQVRPNARASAPPSPCGSSPALLGQNRFRPTRAWSA